MPPTNNPTRAELQAMDLPSLKELAKARGLTVADTATQAQYVDALAPTEPGAKAAKTGAAKAQQVQRLDQTVPGGHYITADGKHTNANGDELDESGKIVRRADGSAPED